MGEERVHLLARKVDTVYLSIESASCNLSCRWYHLLPKSTYLQWSKRVMPSWDGLSRPSLWPAAVLPPHLQEV